MPSKRVRRQAVSTAELYAALEALLPYARTEVLILAEDVRDFPNDPDHAANSLRSEKGLAALDMAERLIARKSGNIRRKQRALEEATTDA